jgi:hypothetical protein
MAHCFVEQSTLASSSSHCNARESPDAGAQVPGSVPNGSSTGLGPVGQQIRAGARDLHHHLGRSSLPSGLRQVPGGSLPGLGRQGSDRGGEAGSGDPCMVGEVGGDAAPKEAAQEEEHHRHADHWPPRPCIVLSRSVLLS